MKKMNREIEDFEIKVYSKSELAMLYNPHQKVSTAVSTLRRWLHYNPKILHDLYQTGYVDTAKLLTPRQVAIIVSYLGAP